MTSHYKTVCRHCDTIMAQCKCISPDKTIRLSICGKCKDKATNCISIIQAIELLEKTSTTWKIRKCEDGYRVWLEPHTASKAFPTIQEAVQDAIKHR